MELFIKMEYVELTDSYTIRWNAFFEKDEIIKYNLTADIINQEIGLCVNKQFNPIKIW